MCSNSTRIRCASPRSVTTSGGNCPSAAFGASRPIGDRGQATQEVESGEARGDAGDHEWHGKRRRDRRAQDEEQEDERDREVVHSAARRSG